MTRTDVQRGICPTTPRHWGPKVAKAGICTILLCQSRRYGPTSDSAQRIKCWGPGGNRRIVRRGLAHQSRPTISPHGGFRNKFRMQAIGGIDGGTARFSAISWGKYMSVMPFPLGWVEETFAWIERRKKKGSRGMEAEVDKSDKAVKRSVKKVKSERDKDSPKTGGSSYSMAKKCCQCRYRPGLSWYH